MPSSLLLLFYICTAVTALLAVWLLRRYQQERRYRRLPYVAPTEAGWETRQPPAAATLRHRVALIGDLGAVATDGHDPILNLLQAWMQEAGPESTVIILGDNVYPTGLPAPEHSGRAAAELRLNTQLDALRAYAGRVVFLSGNHDWNKGRADGYAYLLRQEAYVREHLPAAHYLPPNGCPGPVTVQLAENLLLLVLNTQWWVQNGERPLGPAAGCTATDARAPFRALHDILEQNRHQQVVVAGHHPLYSNALHGGKFTAKQHVFPLTTLHKKAYVPLPVLGSFFPLYRKLMGAEEDMAHPKYRKMRRRLLRVLHGFPNVIYAAGHDHNLQYFHYRAGHYLVSGAGSKTAFVQPGGKASFAHEHKGFFSLDFYHDGEAWLRTLEPAATTAGPAAEVFRKRLLPAYAPALTQSAARAAAAPEGFAE
ncbi:Calcineurin-like phosphoesterase [Hymenobacter daecheongensis DSM 21074]|uniref:Calcineurin-like phosphoesterase n=1 Tax=Hymenobacter daecheongensis DSM 21074 TaxID=1121955 RepID=A0A1M6JWS1_9BACT|nr:metallophosphoesterase [Hymenobacter daecheongensis]SHJ51068.1 Calcineurin-like phosphoesterase [Hymenobacter daecheongensis DSM 21074]